MGRTSQWCLVLPALFASALLAAFIMSGRFVGKGTLSQMHLRISEKKIFPGAKPIPSLASRKYFPDISEKKNFSLEFEAVLFALEAFVESMSNVSTVNVTKKTDPVNEDRLKRIERKLEV